MIETDAAEAMVLFVPGILTLFILCFGALLVLQPDPTDELRKKNKL